MSRQLVIIHLPTHPLGRLFRQWVYTIDQYAFRNTDIDELIIPESVTSIGYEAFKDVYFEKVVLLSNPSISSYAFYNANKAYFISPLPITTTGKPFDKQLSRIARISIRILMAIMTVMIRFLTTALKGRL